MLLSEVYGSYYNAVARILTLACEGRLTKAALNAAVRDKAFAESVLTVPAALTEGRWPLLTADFKTPLRSVPTMPLTALQMSWLKSLLQDPRIALFAPPVDGLEDAQPLFEPQTFVYFDRFDDSDPYSDEDYVKNFRTAVAALKNGVTLWVRYGDGDERQYLPRRLEYSAKDDKFRLIALRNGKPATLNMAKIRACRLGEPCPLPHNATEPEKRVVTAELTDERNTLERVMTCFSHLRRQTERLDEKHYRFTLEYDAEDEAEMLIRILAFGPTLRVISPPEFIQKLADRINRQNELRT